MKIILVTGANRGIGREVARQLGSYSWGGSSGADNSHSSGSSKKIILCGRDAKALEQTRQELSAAHDVYDTMVVDMQDEGSIKNLSRQVSQKYDKLDVLINNAGIFIGEADTLKSDSASIEQSFRANTLGPFLLAQALHPLLKKSTQGRIINVSSGMGGLTEMGGGYPAYRISKTALNAVTRILANDLQKDNIKVNSVCPGWVKTDMGGANATREVEKGAETIVYLATADEIVSGKFLRDKQEILW